MATNSELKFVQKANLFDLLKLQKDTGNSKHLEALIIKQEATMEAEDVAYVHKQIERLP